MPPPRGAGGGSRRTSGGRAAARRPAGRRAGRGHHPRGRLLLLLPAPPPPPPPLSSPRRAGRGGRRGRAGRGGDRRLTLGLEAHGVPPGPPAGGGSRPRDRTGPRGGAEGSPPCVCCGQKGHHLPWRGAWRGGRRWTRPAPVLLIFSFFSGQCSAAEPGQSPREVVWREWKLDGLGFLRRDLKPENVRPDAQVHCKITGCGPSCRRFPFPFPFRPRSGRDLRVDLP